MQRNKNIKDAKKNNNIYSATRDSTTITMTNKK